MTANVGVIDRAIRFVLAFIALVLLVTHKVHGWLAIVLGIVCAMLVITAVVRFCPMYTWLKIGKTK